MLSTPAKIRTCVLKRLTSREHALVGLEQESEELYALLHATVTTGTSNSMLLMGPRGGGKTALLETTLAKLQQSTQSTSGGDESASFYTVKLSGLVQTDDKLAFRDIARQLLRQQRQAGSMQSAEARLLLGEDEEQQEEDEGDASFVSYAEALTWLLNTLKAGSSQSIPIIIVLDEFDLFEDHQKQLLLYTLFDIAQSKMNAMAVVGLTCRLDAVSLLEKRVRSRFSHRIILVPGIARFEDYLNLAVDSLRAPKPVEKARDKHRRGSDDTGDAERDVHLWRYDQSVDEIAQLPAFIEMVRTTYDTVKDVRSLYQLLTPAILQLSDEQPVLAWPMFEGSVQQQKTDGKMLLVRGLSLLEVSLVLACKTLLDSCVPQFNFEMMYDEYKEFLERTGRQAGLERYKKAVALKAYEHLLACELLKPADSSAKGPKEYRMVKLLMTVEQIKGAVQGMTTVPSVLKQWAAK
ncbi:origin recognition complex subunit 4 [Sorochytrium milnesiophthora]